jgi:RND family efflux transporter MFP subunit
MKHSDMSNHRRRSGFIVKVGKFLIPLMLIMAGGVAWTYFAATAPVIERAAPQRQVTVVDVQTVGQKDARTVISAMGTVVPACKVTLKAQIAGTVESISAQFVPGARVAQGAVLLTLDRSDYEVSLQKAESALAEARAALSIEQGSQNIAREELRLLSELSAEGVAHTDLALRKPQLQQARAKVISAEADLHQAKLNLNRTVVRAPFNAMVIERNVHAGAYAGAQESLATIVGTDEFWIEAAVSLDQLALMDLDYPGGCAVAIRTRAGGGPWEGRVIQIAGKLNEISRMATVIVAVQNPLDTALNPTNGRLMIDDFVHAQITGRELADVIELPRDALQDNDTVWVNNNHTLDIRKVTLAWKSTDKVYLQSGVAPGEQVVMSSLSVPVQGMPLATADTASDGAKTAAGK